MAISGFEDWTNAVVKTVHSVELQIEAILKHCLGITQPAPAVRKPLVSKTIASFMISTKENKTPCREKVPKQKHAEVSPSSNASIIPNTTSDVIFASDLFDEMKHSTRQATSASWPTKNNSHLLDQSASMELPNPVVAVVTTSPVTCAGDLKNNWQHPTTEATSAISLSLNNSPNLNVRASHEINQQSASMELPNPVLAVVTTSPVTCAGDLRKDWQHPTNQYQNRRINAY
ncbi:hypothetical protein OUZ56_017274 [Daphnia magna]|uniref:Uncharacterized protein n=1 Tax=Daphnia magna TaxID=35525 RepID=A0ABR0ASK0_9CRUS|nr:hypothetical protein OUZ56_017274 [Daphnia magna]